jgi:hypothetical protein
LGVEGSFAGYGGDCSAPGSQRTNHPVCAEAIEEADEAILAGEFETGDILTLDSDFEIYRWGTNKTFRFLL